MKAPYRVRVITPITTEGFRDPDEFGPGLSDLMLQKKNQLTVDFVGIERGSASIECEFDDMLVSLDTANYAIQAEKEGMDAIIIDCMIDPGLAAIREVLSIPVIGVCNTSMHYASMLAHEFCVVTVTDSLIPVFDRLAQEYGAANYSKTLSVDIPVLEIEKDITTCELAIIEASIGAVKNHGATAIVLGCTGFLGLSEKISTTLEEKFGYYIPVTDPLPLAILHAGLLLDLGYSHSKQAFHTTGLGKSIKGFEELEHIKWLAANHSNQ